MASLSPVIVWLRNDLRLEDHEPLHRAVQSGAPVALVYCVDPRQFRMLPSGVPKTGSFRAQFLIESLTALRDACRDRASDLVVRHGMPETVLPALARELNAERVFYHEEVASDETTVEAEVEAALNAVGVRLEGCWGHTLFHPDDLPFDLQALPDVFTSFRKLVERDATVRALFPAPSKLHSPSIDAGEIPTLDALGLSAPVSDARVKFSPRGGERAAIARLTHYVWSEDRLRDYKDTRNGMLAVDDSSKLSPWLAIGCLSPRRVWAEVQRYERERVKNESTYWMIFELLWRDYFRFVAAKDGDAIFRSRGLQELVLPWRTLDDDDTRAHLDRWTSGTTGFPIVDASMQELAASGFMSNRGRQNVASFLTKNLGIDWRLGAEWFESMLVDYDVSSNWGNWLYSAGVGNDARGFRYFNLYKQSTDYDPNGDFVRHWLPALRNVPGADAHRPSLLSYTNQQRYGVAIGSDYPEPMVDLYDSAKINEANYRRAFAASRTNRPTQQSGRRRSRSA